MSIVIPVYYNGLNLPETIPQLLALETKLPGYSLQLIFVDDGSGDNSFDILLSSQHEHPDKIKVVKLTRNFGSMAAIQAGFTQADGDCVGIIAADLQDPPELFIEMAEYWEKGIKSIFAVRQDREEPFTQKLFSNTYYALMKKFAIPNYPTGGFDFLLVDRQVIEEINKVHEKNTNLLSLIYWLGFKSILIPYVRRSRKKGKSRWTLKKKIKLLVDSFVSFSYFPIQFLSVIGFLVAVAAFGYGTFVFYFWLVYGIEVKGWVPLIVLLAFTSGIQMTMLGILGEYLWRTLDEARKRPVYVIDEIYIQNSETRSPIPKNPTPEGKNS
jgi:polyisoprenyl-phosphate glycosyltransferase